jgi:hypothetical protein
MWYLKKIVSINFLSLVSNFDILGRLCFKVNIKLLKKNVHFWMAAIVHLRSQHTQDFFYNRNYDYYILFYLDQINVIPS